MPHCSVCINMLYICIIIPYHWLLNWAATQLGSKTFNCHLAEQSHCHSCLKEVWNKQGPCSHSLRTKLFSCQCIEASFIHTCVNILILGRLKFTTFPRDSYTECFSLEPPNNSSLDAAVDVCIPAKRKGMYKTPPWTQCWMCEFILYIHPSHEPSSLITKQVKSSCAQCNLSSFCLGFSNCKYWSNLHQKLVLDWSWHWTLTIIPWMAKSFSTRDLKALCMHGWGV